MSDPEQVKLRNNAWSKLLSNNREIELNDEIDRVATIMVDMGKPVEDVMAIIKKAVRRKK